MDGSTDIGAIAEDLLRAAVAATPEWVHRCVGAVATSAGCTPSTEAIETAAHDAAMFVEERLGALLRTDIDEQRSTPLTVFRDAVRFPADVLTAAGMDGAPPDGRSDGFPSDPFGLTPGALSDIGADVHRAGLVWGAAKAGLHLQRRRAEGLR